MLLASLKLIGVFVLIWGHFSYFPLVLYFPIFTIFYKNFIFFMSISQVSCSWGLMFWIGRAENNSKNNGSEAIQSWVQTCLWCSSIQKHLTSGLSQNCCVYIRPFFFFFPWKAIVKPTVFWLLFWSFDVWRFLGLALSYSL